MQVINKTVEEQILYFLNSNSNWKLKQQLKVIKIFYKLSGITNLLDFQINDKYQIPGYQNDLILNLWYFDNQIGTKNLTKS